jgi:hypothetical protein
MVAYEVTHAVDMPPGRFEFRVSATSTKLRKGASVYLDTQVPEFRTAALTLGGLVVGYADGQRVAVAPPASGAARAAALPFAPTLDRIFTSSDTLLVHAQGTARIAKGLAASIEIIRADGTRVTSVSPPLSPGETFNVDGRVPLAGLRGPYTLRMTASANGQSTARDIGIVVR